MSETSVPQPEVQAAPSPSSLLERLRADVAAEAKALGVDVEKLWALIKEHM